MSAGGWLYWLSPPTAGRGGAVLARRGRLPLPALREQDFRRMSAPTGSKAAPLTTIQWLVCGVAALGFAFDTYELLMTPYVARPALTQFFQSADPSFDPY